MPWSITVLIAMQKQKNLKQYMIRNYETNSELKKIYKLIISTNNERQGTMAISLEEQTSIRSEFYARSSRKAATSNSSSRS